MSEHDEYKVIRVDGDKKYRSCGCIETGYGVTMENMCPESRRVAEGILDFLNNTDEGRARVAEVRKEAGLA